MAVDTVETGEPTPSEMLALAIALIEKIEREHRHGFSWWDSWFAEDILERYANDDLDAFLIVLAHYPAAGAAKFVAQHEKSPARALQLLSTYPDVEVLSAVAENANCSADTLSFLSQHPVLAVRVSVANTSAVISENLAASLAEDPHPTVRRMLAQRSDLVPSQVSQLAEDSEREVVEAAIKNPLLPLPTAKKLLRVALQSTPVPEWINVLLWEGARYDDEDFINDIAEAASTHFPDAWETILGGENTPVSLLEAAAKRRSRLAVGAAAALAGNQRTPVASLNRLAKDKRVGVLEALLENPSLSEEAVTALADSPHEKVAGLAYQHPAIPVEKLTADLKGPSKTGAALNPKTPGEVLALWAREFATNRGYPRGDLLGALLHNPNMPGEGWKAMARSQVNSNVRLSALRSKLCPKDLLLEACFSTDRSVRHAASRNPECPEEGRVAAALV